MNTIKGIYESALKEKAEILKELEPLRETEEILIKQLHKIENDLKVIRLKIVDKESERLAEVSKLIARLAPNQKKMNGGK